MSFNYINTRRSVTVNSQPREPEHGSNPIILQRQRQDIVSPRPPRQVRVSQSQPLHHQQQQQQQQRQKFSFGDLPDFTALIDNRSRYSRSSSIHSLNVNANDQDLETDLPPLKSQDDVNFEFLNRSDSAANGALNGVKKYHNYNNFSSNTNNVEIQKTRNYVPMVQAQNNIRKQSNSTTIFTRNIHPSEILAHSPLQTSTTITNSGNSQVEITTPSSPAPSSNIFKQSLSNFTHGSDTDDGERFKAMPLFKSFCSHAFKITLVIIALLYHLTIKLKTFVIDEEEDIEQGLRLRMASGSSVMDVDTPENSVSEMDTPLASKITRKQQSHQPEEQEQKFNASSLNWGSGSKSTAKPKTSKNDYGTHFMLEQEVEDEEPNVELEYMRRIFNNEGKFELQFYNNERQEAQPVERKPQSISQILNLSERFRNALGVEDQEDEVEIIKDRKLPARRISKYEIDDNNFKEESLLLFEEEFKTYQSIIDEKRRRQELIQILKTQKESKVKKLDQGQLAIVYKYLHSPDLNLTVKQNLNGVELKVKDLKTLENARWLNDNVIDAYLSLVTKRSQANSSFSPCFAFTTHFYTTLADKGYKSVQRWAKRQKIDVTQLDYIFVPINSMNTHWSLAVINNKLHKFQYYDSLSLDHDFADESQIEFHRRKNLRILQHLIVYMKEEDKRLHGSATVDYDDYQLLPVLKSPQQKNGSDCGVFTCTAVEFLARDQFLGFSQADMENLRLKMCFELLQETLL